MGFAAGRKRFIRDTQNLAARLRVITYVCEGCGLWGGSTKPAQCRSCGAMAFLRFDSKAEAERWATLRLLEAQGVITQLQRQVRFPLFAFKQIPGIWWGGKAKVGEYIADFVYNENGETIREDLKGGSITDLSAWKIKHMAAQGMPVKLVKAYK